MSREGENWRSATGLGAVVHQCPPPVDYPPFSQGRRSGFTACFLPGPRFGPQGIRPNLLTTTFGVQPNQVFCKNAQSPARMQFGCPAAVSVSMREEFTGSRGPGNAGVSQRAIVFPLRTPYLWGGVWVSDPPPHPRRHSNASHGAPPQRRPCPLLQGARQRHPSEAGENGEGRSGSPRNTCDVLVVRGRIVCPPLNCGKRTILRGRFLLGFFSS